MGKLTAEQRKKMLQSYVSSLKSRKANITPKTRIAKTLKTSQEENQDENQKQNDRVLIHRHKYDRQILSFHWSYRCG